MHYMFKDDKIVSIIRTNQVPDFKSTKQIVKKALDLRSLNLYEIDLLLKGVKDDTLFNYIIESANELKQKVFGKKVKIYIPVYITNVCVNKCIYCGFRRDNKSLNRKTLSLEEFKKEIDFVLDIGHHTIELVLGHHPKLKGYELAKYVEYTASELRKREGGSVILMSAPLGTKDYKILKQAGLDEVYCWQETYNRERYEEVHPPNTPKYNYSYRTGIFERVLEAGIQRYGMGVLFGLYNWEYDVLSLLQHAKWLEGRFGITPHALGVPRFKKAHGPTRRRPFCRVTNKMYRLSVAVYRLAFPYTQTYLNTRENIEFILQLLKGGGSEVNIEASTYPGGYTDGTSNGQFFHYSYDSGEVFKTLRRLGLQPSFK